MAKILITGGSGLVGRAVSDLLLKKQHQPVWLSREAGEWKGIRKFKWDPATNYLDEKALDGVEHIIHLAGSGIVDQRWTPRYKQEIIDSRVKSAALLFSAITKQRPAIKSMVGAGAIGYYGARQNSHLFTEDDFPGTDFLAKTCVLWEKSYVPFSQAGIRTTVARTGIVIGKHGGFYGKLAPLFRLGLGAAMASGRQYMPWIHLNDMAAAYVHLLFNEALSGPYNAVASELITNKEFSKQMAASFHKPLLLPNVPGFALRLAVGEGAATITEGLKISNEKIKASGFVFEFEEALAALRDLNR